MSRIGYVAKLAESPSHTPLLMKETKNQQKLNWILYRPSPFLVNFENYPKSNHY
jgi:hypothetical protein